MSWLHTRASDKKKQTRGQELKEKAKLPPVRLGYILDMLTECGWYELSWQEVKAWLDATATPANSWDVRAMITASREYAIGLIEYRDKQMPPPYFDGVIDRAAVEQQVKQALRGR